MSEKTKTVPATLAGRCANGNERGQGVVVHAVECSENELRFGINFYARSLCGKTHGARSAGWTARSDLTVTCPKCIKKMAEASNTRGWTIKHPKYGKWFISRQAVINDWKKSERLAYPDAPETEPCDEEIETWFNEQTSWVEVRAYGTQLERPDMAAWENLWKESMKKDTSYLTDCDLHEVQQKKANDANL